MVSTCRMQNITSTQNYPLLRWSCGFHSLQLFSFVHSRWQQFNYLTSTHKNGIFSLLSLQLPEFFNYAFSLWCQSICSRVSVPKTLRWLWSSAFGCILSLCWKAVALFLLVFTESIVSSKLDFANNHCFKRKHHVGWKSFRKITHKTVTEPQLWLMIVLLLYHSVKSSRKI